MLVGKKRFVSQEGLDHYFEWAQSATTFLGFLILVNWFVKKVHFLNGLPIGCYYNLSCFVPST